MSCSPPTRCATTAATRFIAVLLGIALLTGALVAGCLSSESATDPVDPTTTLGGMTADEVAGAVVENYAEAMQELLSLLEDKPEPAVVLPEVQDLKEEYVQKLVALGHQRERLGEPEKAQVNALQLSAMMDASEEPWFAEYGSLYSYYMSIDRELANLIADFNILTQYSDFELLRAQSPEEAERLGVAEPE